ncbi:MAG: hypothetical protein ACRC1K_08035, partial [Planctomycetia bacterium]
MVKGGMRIDQNFACLRDSCGVESSQIDSIAVAVLRFACPSDDEIAVGFHGDRRETLTSGRRRVHADVASLRCAGGIVPSRVDAVIVALSVAIPNDDEVPSGVHRHVTAFARQLISGREIIDRKLWADRRGGDGAVFEGFDKQAAG